MLYRVRSTGAVKNQGGIRKMFPNTSLPRVWTKEVCDAIGIDLVEPTSPPEVTELQRYFEDGVKEVNGKWYQDWMICPKFPDYVRQDPIVDENGDPVLDAEGNPTYNEVTVTRAEQEAAYLAKKVAEKEASVRAERDKKLAETDWMVIKAAETGVALATGWATYRQALRDVTAQEGFPDNVTWPTVE
jgi:hypothetical protein